MTSRPAVATPSAPGATAPTRARHPHAAALGVGTRCSPVINTLIAAHAPALAQA